MLTMQDIEEIKRDAAKLTRRRFEDAADEGSFEPTPTPGADGDADASQTEEANDADHVLGDTNQRKEVEETGVEQNEQAESVDGEEKPKRGRPAKDAAKEDK